MCLLIYSRSASTNFVGLIECEYINKLTLPQLTLWLRLCTQNHISQSETNKNSASFEFSISCKTVISLDF